MNTGNESAGGIYRGLTSYGDVGFSKYLRRAFLASAGFDAVDLDRPIIGIVDTSSDFNTCHRQMPELTAAVKRGILEAGGLPFAFPTISLHEIYTHPTTMLYRNLMAIDTEEMIKAQPMDAVVLLSGCDKTVPAQVMGAISAGRPAICVVAGPMLTGSWRGERLGACTDCRRWWAEFRAGRITARELAEIEKELCATAGTCMVMGTASTMACLVEALGMMLPGGATPPSGSGARLRQAVATGRRAVALAREGLTPERLLNKASFHNAMIVLAALSGSTNAVIHLTAIAGRLGITLDLDAFHGVAARTPLLVDCKPAGRGYMEDFHKAGGMPVLMKALSPLLHLEARTITGITVGELLEGCSLPPAWQDIIHPLEKPLGPAGSLATLSGSLAPGGAIIKTAAASPALLRHRGRAVVFESPEDVIGRIDDPALEITPEHVLIMRNAGPIGAGMPEAGALPIPRYLAKAGVSDMVRISDARMSGTAYGTIVLHCCPEAAAGGPLALVKDGDMVELDVVERRIDLLVDDDELSRRRAAWRAPVLPPRGWLRLHAEHVQPASRGADLDFLVP
ncbi:dihydroxy-acid dehydratase [bacterium]|nr:dihydroxy-acid dehydratase [candidate division CSSED10-310 bacterium]